MKKKSKLKKILIVLIILALALFLIIVPSKRAAVLNDAHSISGHSENPPLLVAHRGFSSIYPQNTLPAFEGAVEAGFDGFELDIHTTKDGKWVVIHDDTVDAMTDGTGNVEDFTFEEIRKFKIDGGNGIERYTDLKVPSLDEALSLCEGNDIIPVIEIKKCDVKYLPSLKEYLDESSLSERAVIISFTREYLEEYRKLDNQADIMLLSHVPTKEDVEWCLQHSAGLNFNYNNFYKSFSAVGYAKEKGVKLASWTVDNTIYKDIMVLFGAEIITTNKIAPADYANTAG